MAQKDFSHGPGSISPVNNTPAPNKTFPQKKVKTDAKTKKDSDILIEPNGNSSAKSTNLTMEAEVRKVVQEEISKANAIKNTSTERMNNASANFREEEIRKMAREEAEKAANRISSESFHANNPIFYDTFCRLNISFAYLGSELSSDYNKITPESSDKGISIECLVGIPFSYRMPIFFESGIGASWVRDQEDDLHEDFVTISIPLLLGVQIPLAAHDNLSIEISGGVLGKFHALGQISNNHDQLDYFSKEDMGVNVFNRYQGAYCLRSGLNIGSVYLGYSYSKDFTTLHSKTDFYTYVHLFTFGINF